MEEQEIKVAKEVISRLNLPAESNAPVMSYVREIGWRIKNYCQISTVPEGLFYTWVAMVIDVLRVEQSANDDIGDTIDTSGDNVKVGDTSVTGGSASAAASKAISKPIIDNVVTNYLADLNRYRKMRW
ncbi:DNA-packaging protein [Paenibacillus macerans]|uniref:DNA-packaging protein n=1 Tax=Paenibacillus macerans TaxID=44252 RepID=UPI00203C1817|nr:DNA-packaging protein [Paenibacillus macerans]MCM3701434.1 DNA-packaging protein [Paenibacillus macerans]